MSTHSNWRVRRRSGRQAVTELVLLQAYHFPGYVTVSDGSVGPDSVYGGGVHLDGQVYGNL